MSCGLRDEDQNCNGTRMYIAPRACIHNVNFTYELKFAFYIRQLNSTPAAKLICREKGWNDEKMDLVNITFAKLAFQREMLNVAALVVVVVVYCKKNRVRPFLFIHEILLCRSMAFGVIFWVCGWSLFIFERECNSFGLRCFVPQDWKPKDLEESRNTYSLQIPQSSKAQVGLGLVNHVVQIIDYEYSWLK